MFANSWGHAGRIALAAVCVLPSAHAQSELQSNRFDLLAALDPVVVTASRFELSPRDRPIATQVITAEEIEASSALTVGEVLSKLGGIHSRINFTGIPDSSLDLRGFGATGDQNTLVLINGQRLSPYENTPARLSSVPINSIERIEILSGAGGVLYGSGATGGVINIITRTPKLDNPQQTVSVLKGSYGLFDIRASFQALDDGRSYSLYAQSYETDNYRRGNKAQFKTANGEIRQGGINNFTSLTFGIDDQKSELPGARSINLATGINQFRDDPRGITTPDDKIESASNFINLRSEQQYDSLLFGFDLGFQSKKRDSFGSYATGSSENNKSDLQRISISSRAKLSFPISGYANDLTVGLDLEDWSYRNKNTSISPNSSGGYDQESAQDNIALYFRNELFISSGTRIELGYRSENVKQRDNTLIQREKRNKLHASDISLQHHLSSASSLYLRFSESYRLANVDEIRCAFNYELPCNDLLKPQSSDSFELGFDLLSGLSKIRTALFSTNVDNEIHFDVFGFKNVNLPPTKHEGIELDAKWFLTEAIHMGLRYRWTKAQFRSGTFNGLDFDKCNIEGCKEAGFSFPLRGKEVPLVPRHRIGADLMWQVTQNTRTVFFVNYVGVQRYDNDQGNAFKKMPSYITSDLKVTHKNGPWLLSIGINNIFDEAYYSFGAVNVSAKPSRFNVYPEARRNGYISATYTF